MSPESPIIAPLMPPWLDAMRLGITPDYQYSLLDSKGQSFWKSNVGPQTWGMFVPFDEVVVGGSRGGGKSAWLIAWMMAGDLSLPADDPARYSFINDPSYRGLLLREEYASMADFVEQAVEFYRHFGGKPSGNPTVVDFASKGSKLGAKIYFNHLGDEEAYNKYRGWNLTKIGIEELTRIETLKRYLKLMGSLRSVDRVRNGKLYPKLRTQLGSTTNPDGPGMQWVKDRFIEVYQTNGKMIPWNTPMRDPISGLRRIFIPAKLADNPYLKDDRKYMGMLLSQDEVTRKQWIEGDWNAGAGKFFCEFRPDGPMGSDEPEWANHVIESAPLKPWWYRWASCDIGYDHPTAFHKFCRNQGDKRIHVYDELVVRQCGAYELGVRFAEWVLPELEGLDDHQMTLYLSPDAFNKTDSTKTKAEQIGLGIQEILGPYGSLLLRYDEGERAAMARDPKAAAALFERRKSQAVGKMCILVKAANNNKDARCDYMRELLRFRPVRTETEGEVKERLQSIFSRSGVEAYERELASYQSHGPEILPKLQIWEKCEGLIRCMKVAQRDDPPKNEMYRKFNAEDGVGGDDELDGCLIAGTMIQTSSGERPIDSITKGDQVWTRGGLRDVLESKMTSPSSKVLRVEFSDGSALVGTGSHPVYLAGTGFVPLNTLRCGDMVESRSAGVHVRSVTDAGCAPVYNLSVAEAEEYYANGVLVHNCSFGLVAHKEIEKTIPRMHWVADRVAQFQEAQLESFGEEITDPTRLAMIAQRQNFLYSKNNQPAGGGTFTFPRAGSTLHRRVN